MGELGMTPTEAAYLRAVFALPDSKWQRCPVCNGVGSVPMGFYPPQGVGTTTTPQKCRTCNGKGMVR